MSGIQRIHLLSVFTLCFLCTAGAQILDFTTPRVETWTGRWLPERPPAGPVASQEDIRDDLHGVKMGVASATCDDARTNLTVDWDFSPVNFTCYNKYRIEPDLDVRPLLEKENIPRFYIAQHKCMDQSIHYDVPLPTFGTHRPLWPRYGEYKFVPRQRWLHNLEHGGIVALYHPCADPYEVHRLRQMVTRCLWRHVISPSNLVDPERPLVLLAWGWRLSLPAFQPALIRTFILEHALRGPEAVSRDGQYDVGLLHPADLVTDSDDSELCP